MESSAFFEACFNSLNFGIAIFNKKGDIIMANSSLAELFNYELDSFQQMNITSLFDNASLIHSFISNKNRTFFDGLIELQGIKQNKEFISIEANFGKIEFEKFIYYKVVVTNISERKAKEAQIVTENLKLEERIKDQNKELEKILKQLSNSLNIETKLLKSVENLLEKNSTSPQFLKSNIGKEIFESSYDSTVFFNSFLKDKKVYKYIKGEAIYCEGNLSNHIFLIKKGIVKTYKTSEYGKSYITDFYTEGNFFGYVSFVKQLPHFQNAQAVTNTQLYKISKLEISNLINKNQPVLQNFILLLANNIINMKEQVISLAYGSVRQKTARVLIKFINYNILSLNNEIFISRQDLANSIGIAKETLIRTLHDFNEEGLIKLNQKSVTVINKANLLKVL
ncbi:cAMP-binding domain of CRP or a regulatory subunit of cAMP-dependent protein kinases [Lutibacter oricola]|uniref:cAMP-binding domain of CRP or a regulatory subunit of cAMP-dependent protein kinases n=2 Tax=Lutibacter oricola TaxID=762486 RepID=A0A1H2XDB6_9FLAO|nr:cAMP-binding domain of CRP or a regulatory subunit of cAMP-dependent protein kinases [Lutibacter oricola]